jgi:hypothetical protein
MLVLIKSVIKNKAEAGKGPSRSMSGTPASAFSLPLLQAINDWQLGGGPKQKARRGVELQRQAQSLPPWFRDCPCVCFRQIALSKGKLWQLADTLQLPESISAWAVSPKVAYQLKGGVPPAGGYQGVIFCIMPPEGSVVVNLDRLFREQGFLDAVAANQDNIVRYGDGIGRYEGSQHEVVLEISQVRLTDTYALGGYSSSRDELAERLFGHKPSAAELADFDRLLVAAKENLGADWITDDAKDRVLARIKAVVPELRSIKRLQDKVQDDGT